MAATVAGGALVLAGPVAAFQATSATDGSVVQRVGATTAADPPTGELAAGTPSADPLQVVHALLDELPEPVDAAALVKAADLALPKPPAAPEPPAAPPPPPSCKPNSAGFGAVKPFVATAGHELRCRFGVDSVLGVGSRSGASDHPLGLALDFLVDRATGDSMADYVLANMDRLGVKYVIWKQRINYGSGWQTMEDRGSATANHFDHVHVSFGAK